MTLTLEVRPDHVTIISGNPTNCSLARNTAGTLAAMLEGLPPGMNPIYDPDALFSKDGMDKAVKHIEEQSNSAIELRTLAKAPHVLALIFSSKYLTRLSLSCGV